MSATSEGRATARSAEGLPRLRVVKGHGTENDFVIVPDLDGELELSERLVRALCDRHAGVGADGVLRVVRSVHAPEAHAIAAEAPWFMDYRNADGSLAETCGNGVRVFLQYLSAAGLVDHYAAVATRGGVMRARLLPDGNVRVEMGSPRILADRPVVTAASTVEASCTADGTFQAVASIDMPNPHVVVSLDDLAGLTRLDLTSAPRVQPPRPDGQNVEFVVQVGERHLSMRVHERGVGETRSCGTGICAVVAALGAPDGSSWRVDIPGGTCWVTWSPDRTITLIGPALLVGEIELSDAWLRCAGS